MRLDARGLFETYPDGVAILDAGSGAIAAANERCGELFGRSTEALVGTFLTDHTPENWQPAATPETLAEQARDERVAFDWRVARPDGTTTTLRCTMRVPSRCGGDEAVVTVRETDNRAEADRTRDDGPTAADDRSDRELRALLDGMSDAVFVVDLEGNYVDANRVAAERLGYTPEELLSMGPADVSPSSHADRVDDRLRRIEADETLVFESVQVTADGERLPVEISARQITYRGAPAVLAVARDVRDRKARRRRLETFERAVEQAGHAVYITDTDGTIEYVNPAFETTTGYDAATAVGRTPSILSTGERDDEYYERLWGTILDGEVWEEAIENQRADGERYHAHQTIAPIEIDGEIVKFVAIQQDVTEREQRETELERYRDLIDNVPVGVYRNTPGPDGKFTEVNPAMVEMFGADSTAGLLELPVAELYRNPGERESFSRSLDSKGRVVDEELRLQTLDGEPFWGAVTAIRHEVDGRVYYDGIIQDVTERREQARRLRLSEQRFRRLFEEHNAPMLLIDPDSGAIERANEAAASFYGYGTGRLESMRIQDINRLDDETVARRRAAADEGEENRFIFPHELASGEVRQVEVDSTPIHTGDGRPLFSILHDVTERERNRKALERQNEQLELLNRVVRHDIRNHMSVVLGHTEVLRDHVDDASAEYLETAHDHGENVVELTRTARELMETMREGGLTDPGSVSLSAVLDAEVADASAGHDDAVFEVERPLPEVAVRGNELLGSVFRNLLTNAVQHNDSDVPMITVRAETDAETVHVAIADNGPGLSDGQKAAVFGKGELGMDSSGTGLGLYLVDTFVDRFDGDVWVTDNEPSGAVFHVELPRVD